MRVSYNWLQEYVDIPWSPEELADRLTMAGLMVETMGPLAQGIDDIVVAEIVGLEPHPRAEQLWIATVTDGVDRYTIVTGAPNASPGMKAPLAKPGVTLPSGLHIETAAFRGVESEGMLCSEAELQAGDDAAGLWALPEDLVVGRPLVEQMGLDDTVFHLEVYPNRPDCLSVIGVAREVAAMTGRRVRLPSLVFEEAEARAEDAAKVRIEDEALCSRYSARVLEGITIGPSPGWLQQRLRVAGMRPINNIVDVTNFVMWEWGQPLHAFDLERIVGGRIVVRRAKAGETVVTLDGQERKLDGDMLVIADESRAVAVAGVMGGADSEVTDGTTRVLLEAAAFHPVSVRRTAQRLALRSEASHRFEKGLDPNLVEAASRRAASLMQRVAGGTVRAGSADVYPRPAAPWTVRCRPSRARALLGVDGTDEQMAAYLQSLELEVEREEDELIVTVPTFRPDLRREADLIEEIARMYGYDNVPARLPGGAFSVARQAPPLPRLDDMRESLVGLGLLETMTYSFVSPDVPDKLEWGADDERRRVIELRNPLKDDMAVMRTTLLSGLLDTAARNRTRRNTAVHVFEIGAVFQPDSVPLQSLPKEARRLGLLMTGRLPEMHWGRKGEPATFYHLKGAVERLCGDLGLTPEFASSGEPSLHPGRRADVFIAGERIGYLGEIHPSVAARWDMDGVRLYCAELDADALAAASDRTSIRYERLPRYPAVERDIALLVPSSVTGGQIESSLREAGGELLEGVRLFDVYEGPTLEAGVRSLAYALTLRAPDRTLTEADAADILRRIDAAMEELGVRRRV